MINKKIHLQAATNLVAIQSLNSSKSVITVTSLGNGSVVNGFSIIGSCTNGIFLNGVSQCNLTNNSIGVSITGIHLLNSNNNHIFNNYLRGDESWYGLLLTGSNNNYVWNNDVSESCYGIYLFDSSLNSIFNNTIRSIMEYPDSTGLKLDNSHNNSIYSNVLIENEKGIASSNSGNNLVYNNVITANNLGVALSDGYNGQYHPSNMIISNNIFNCGGGIIVYSGPAEIHFNKISTFSGYYCLINRGNGIVNATNNWWGSNSVTYINSSTWPSTPYNIYVQNGCVIYDPWLVLTVNNTDQVPHSGFVDISADLTHDNNGNDTYPLGNVPDGIPVYFNTTLGTISTPVYTRNGKAFAR